MDWHTLGATILGSIFTIAGGFFQMYLSDKKRKKENKTQMKINVLETLMGNRAAIAGQYPNEELQVYRAPFISALNRITIAFSDSEEVLNKYNEFKNAVLSSQPVSPDRKNQIFHELIVQMHNNLGMSAPTLEQFITTLY